ncbi:hypothetical protein HFO74_24075 [Rhizobium laguerreae]|uniref:Uncharacterized protein n=1 Tax=Rhizobium laguerreae TaxID=1076926 RepID=A0AB35FI85_9HYPH|nr:hypothetical protein [Rhizobium laguerreae]MBY3066454.1 hypothetical protein [Rhizobium laguerreae]MBY3080923.1 hypothetical protein [Rhizobium laguerreae]MBY3113918.1 hypothetical protein [Rhizobium laguerreae]MBY3240829.1 hypothetical protein [Rhizobium laguerreae]MBY3302316.1 hypothetical protein [Rhizobium laguerreae]
MNSHEDEAERRNAFAVGTWENKCSASGRYSMEIEHDRRIESARSSTVYRVSANAPVHADHAVTGKSRPEAGKDMMSFNLLNIGYRKEWLRLSDAARSARQTPPVQPWR